jgi:hypothetical protein
VARVFVGLKILAFVAAIASASAAHAVDFTNDGAAVGSRTTDTSEEPRLRMTGMIDPGDGDRLSDILAKMAASAPAKPGKPGEPWGTIELSSMGGNLADGFQIGTLLRKYGVIAVVRQRDICMSSCALALLGGNARHAEVSKRQECNLEIGGKVAFHNFFLNRNGLADSTLKDPVESRLQGFTDARGGAAMLIKYAGEMGLPPNFVASMMGRPVDDFQYIETVGQFLSFHICPLGIERPKIALDLQAVNVCNNSIGGSRPAAQFEATLIRPPQEKLYLLQRLQESMQASKSKGRLLSQLTGSGATRSKEEIDRLYDDLRSAGVALPEIVGTTFEIGSKVSGGYEISCYVSLSPDDPDKYDVVVQTARGFTEPPRLPPENSRRLFLFDRNDVINPRPR